MTAVATTSPPATAADVVALVPGVWSAGAPEAAVSWALSQVQDYCGRRFAEQTDHTVTVTPNNGHAMLPDPPVSSVAAVQGLIRPVGGTELAWTDLAGYECTPDGELYDTRLRRWPAWPTRSHSLKVTYTHGFTHWPQAIVDAVKQLAAGYLVNPTGMNVHRVADTNYQWLAGLIGASGIGGLDRYVLLEAS